MRRVVFVCFLCATDSRACLVLVVVPGVLHEPYLTQTILNLLSQARVSGLTDLGLLNESKII